MSGLRDPSIVLAELAIALSPLMPSEAAAPAAALEWRLARRAWIRALDQLGFSEDDARQLLAAARGEALALLLRDAKPEGRA